MSRCSRHDDDLDPSLAVCVHPDRAAGERGSQFAASGDTFAGVSEAIVTAWVQDD